MSHGTLSYTNHARTRTCICTRAQANTTSPFVFLSSTTSGVFSDNAFAMAPGRTLLTFVPLEGMKVLPSSLSASLRVEHLQPHLFL